MQSISLIPSKPYDDSLYVAEMKNCDGGMIVLDDRITKYYMDVNDTTAVSIDMSQLHLVPNSTIEFTLIVYSTGSNVLNLSGFNVEQIQVLDGESTFSIMKGVGDAYWIIQMKSSDTRPEQWLRCYEKPYVPQFNTGVCAFFNAKGYSSGDRYFGILSEFAPGQTGANADYGSFAHLSDNVELYAKFPIPVWINTVHVMVSTTTSFIITNFPISLQVYGTNDGESWTQILNTSLSAAYGSTDAYSCATTNYYTMFKFIFTFRDSTTYCILPALALKGFSGELINTGAYSFATPYCTTLPLNGYDIETNTSSMSSTSGNIYSLTQFNTSNIYTMTRSDANTPWEYIFTFPEAIRTIGFSYLERYEYCFNLFTLSYSDDKEIWTEYCKVSGTLDAWNKSFNQNQFASYYYDSKSEHRYYKITVYSNSNGNNVQQLAGLSFIQFQKGHYFMFESFIPKLSSNMQGGYILVASSSTQGDAYKLFDYSASSYGGGDISDGEWSLLIQLPQATVVKGLELVSPADGYNRMPYAFSIQGSQDNDTWTNIKTFLLGSNYWSSALQLGQWDIENETAYLYYRLVVTNTSQGSTVRIGEMGLSSYASFKGVNWYEEEYLVPVMASESQDGYIASAKSYWGSHYPWKAFDRTTSNSDDAWECNDSDKADSSGNCNTWLQIQLPEAKVANVLYLQERNGKGTRDPRDFSLEGSNDGTTWITLLTQTDQSYTEKSWTFENTTAYSYYRLNITKSNQSSDNVCVGIMNLTYRTHRESN